MTPTVRWNVSVALLVGLFGILGVGADLRAAPITFNSAMPVAEDDVVLRFQTTTLRASEDPSPRSRDLTVQATALIGAYGESSDLALIGILPYLDKEMSQRTWSSPRGDVGLGDVRGFVRYAVYRNNDRRAQIAAAPFIGLEAPTGEHEKAGLPPPLQLGSGSWDPLAGVTFKNTGLYRGQFASVAYQHNTESDGFEFGDSLRVNHAYQAVLREYGTNRSYATLTGLLESNLEIQERHEQNGMDRPNTGGTTLYLSPGLQYVKRHRVLEASIQVPVVQNLHGQALEEDFLITLGSRWNF